MPRDAAAPDRYRAVFFDVGETLVYAHPSSTEIMAEVCREAGWAITAAEIERADAVVWPRAVQRQVQARAGDLYSISAENSARFWQWVYGEILAQLDAPPALRADLARRFHERFMALETWRLFPDSVPLLEALQPRRRTGLALGVVSNWEEWLETLLAQLRIDRYFDFFVVSATAGLEKPDPAIFHAALHRAGVAAQDAVHVGDSVHADVEGARAAGIRPVLLDRHGRQGPEHTAGVTVIRSLAELPALLG